MLRPFPTSFVDATAVQRFDELRLELEARGVRLGTVHAKRRLGANFEKRWVAERHATEVLAFPTLRSAVQAFEEASGRLRNGDHGADCDAAILDDPDAEGQTAPANGTQPEQRN